MNNDATVNMKEIEELLKESLEYNRRTGWTLGENEYKLMQALHKKLWGLIPDAVKIAEKLAGYTSYITSREISDIKYKTLIGVLKDEGFAKQELFGGISRLQFADSFTCSCAPCTLVHIAKCNMGIIDSYNNIKPISVCNLCPVRIATEDNEMRSKPLLCALYYASFINTVDKHNIGEKKRRDLIATACSNIASASWLTYDEWVADIVLNYYS